MTDYDATIFDTEDRLPDKETLDELRLFYKISISKVFLLGNS